MLTRITVPASTRKRLLLVLSVVATAGPLLSACHAHRGSAARACDVVGTNDVRRVLSRDVAAGVPSGGGTHSGCAYSAGAVRVEVALDRNDSRAGFRSDRRTYDDKPGHVRFRMPYGKDFTYESADHRTGVYEILHYHVTLRVTVIGTAHPVDDARRLARAGADQL